MLPVRFANVPSTTVAFPEWRALLLLCDRLAAEEPDLAGIVIGHGTASLEETAYFLSLTLKTSRCPWCWSARSGPTRRCPPMRG